MVSHVQIMLSGKVMKKAMYGTFMIGEKINKNQQKQIYIYIKMIDLRVDWLQRCTNSITHTETDFRNSNWQLPFLDFWKQDPVISLGSNQLQSSPKNRADQHFKFPLHRKQRHIKNQTSFHFRTNLSTLNVSYEIKCCVKTDFFMLILNIFLLLYYRYILYMVVNVVIA